ncbi:MAG: hypothetical protein HY363_03900 [Candidatus Aenigmarchaeota archaeon]|nr:hypothetical protein [Candidatus Aenigmarchaeota archaeon]
MNTTVLVLAILSLIIACSPSEPAGIGGGYGESLILECSAQQPCPAGYQCVAQQGQESGMCQIQPQQEIAVN